LALDNLKQVLRSLVLRSLARILEEDIMGIDEKKVFFRSWLILTLLRWGLSSFAEQSSLAGFKLFQWIQVLEMIILILPK
jgi:hypothetical protein